MQGQTDSSPFLVAKPVINYVFVSLLWLVSCILLGLWLTWFFSGYKFPVPTPAFVSSIASWKPPSTNVGRQTKQKPAAKIHGLTACNLDIKAILQQDTINFATGSARLDNQASQILQRLVRVIEPCKTARVKIVGHTDNTGSGGKNLRLSAKRAEAVADAMQALGMSPARFQVSGVGSSQPVDSNDTAGGRYKNRRIEVRLYE